MRCHGGRPTRRACLHQQRIAVARRQRVEQVEQVIASHRAEHGFDCGRFDLAAAVGNRLVGQRQRVAHRAARRTREQAQPDVQDIPIVMLTAFAEPAYRIRGLTLGYLQILLRRLPCGARLEEQAGECKARVQVRGVQAERLLQMLEPALTVMLGLVLATIMFSVLTPIYDILGKMKF